MDQPSVPEAKPDTLADDIVAPTAPASPAALDAVASDPTGPPPLPACEERAAPSVGGRTHCLNTKTQHSTGGSHGSGAATSDADASVASLVPEKLRQEKLHAAATAAYDIRCHKRIGFNASASSDVSTPVRQDLPLPSALLIKVSPLLTQPECAGLLDSAERWGFDSVEWEYDRKYRDCTRVVAMCPELARVLWRRLLAVLRPSDLATTETPDGGGCRPIGFGCAGVWRPVGVNPCMRISKYDQRGHFSPHRDSAFVITDDRRSALTLLVYLTQGVEGGATAFFAAPTATAGKAASPASAAVAKSDTGAQPLHTVAPHAGDALLFSHTAWHSGQPVRGGCKVVLRTDVIFERAACGILPFPLSRSVPAALGSDADVGLRGSDSRSERSDAGAGSSAAAVNTASDAAADTSCGDGISGSSRYAGHPGYVEAERLFQLSITLQQEGHPAASTAAFIQALELHATVPAGSDLGGVGCAAQVVPLFGRSRSGNGGNAAAEAAKACGRALAHSIHLPECIIALILELLGPRSVCGLACLNKTWRATASASECWLTFFHKRFGQKAVQRAAWASALDDLGDLSSAHDAVLDSDSNDPSAARAVPITAAARRALYFSRDWKAAYREATEALRTQRLLVVDIGLDSTKFQLLNTDVAAVVMLREMGLDADGLAPDAPAWQRAMEAHVSRMRERRLPTALGEAHANENHGPTISMGGRAVRVPTTIPSVAGAAAGHYWGAGQGAAQMLVGYECLPSVRPSSYQWIAYTTQFQRAWTQSGSGSSQEARKKQWRLNMHCVGPLLAWLARHAFPAPLSTHLTPLLLPVPATMTEAQRALLVAELTSQRFTGASASWPFPCCKLCFPEVTLVDSASLALRAVHRDSGAVIDIGARRIEVALVRNGIVQAAVDVPLDSAVEQLRIADEQQKEWGSGRGKGASTESLPERDEWLRWLRRTTLEKCIEQNGAGIVEAVCRALWRVCRNHTNSVVQNEIKSACDSATTPACILLVGGYARAFAPLLRIRLESTLRTGSLRWGRTDGGTWARADNAASVMLVPRTDSDAALAIMRGAQLYAGARVAIGIEIESLHSEMERARVPLPQWLDIIAL